jgi:hypothetical protein
MRRSIPSRTINEYALYPPLIGTNIWSFSVPGQVGKRGSSVVDVDELVDVVDVLVLDVLVLVVLEDVEVVDVLVVDVLVVDVLVVEVERLVEVVDVLVLELVDVVVLVEVVVVDVDVVELLVDVVDVEVVVVDVLVVVSSPPPNSHRPMSGAAPLNGRPTSVPALMQVDVTSR